jgi:hypothetical protein
MSETAQPEIKDIVPSLLSLEGKPYSQLPDKLLFSEPGLMTSLRLISNRTQDQKKEWMEYLVMHPNKAIEPIYLRPGEEYEAEQVLIQDFTGLYRVDAMLDSLGNNGTHYTHIFGKEITPEMVPEELKGKVYPGQEFYALVHGHTDELGHSPGDFSMVAEQQKRPDGRPLIPNSIVVGPKNIYLLTIPVDGKVDQTGNLFEQAFAGIMGRFSNQEYAVNQGRDPVKLLQHISHQAKTRKIGFYTGSLATGELSFVR